MPTRLKTPITITIEHVENAILVMEACNFLEPRLHLAGVRSRTIYNGAANGEVCPKLFSALVDQGIDWNTWLPSPPVLLRGYEVETLPNGSLKVGCQTITREEILKAKELSDAGVGKESEWPKYFYRGYRLIRAKSVGDAGDMYMSSGAWAACGGDAVLMWASEEKVPQITREEAFKLTGGNL